MPLVGIGAALWGALMVGLAMPDVNWNWPVLLAWPPLLIALRRHAADRWKRRLLWGWLMGFGYTAITFRWVEFTLSEMTNLPPVVTISAMVAFWLWHGLSCGVFAALSEPVRKLAEERAPGSGPVALGVLFVAVEWAFPYLFPWSLGHAFWDVAPLATVQALAGTPGLSFIIMAWSAWAADRWLRSRAAEPSGKSLVWTVATTSPLLIFGLAWYFTIAATEPRRVLKAGIIQPNYTLEEKKNPTFKVRLELMRRLVLLLQTLEPGQFELLVGSEGSFPLFWRLDADEVGGEASGADLWATRRVQALVAKHAAAPLIMGGLRKDRFDKVRNAAVHLGPDGKILGHYDKNILMPFSEYMPGRETFPALENAVKGISSFWPGDTPCRFEAAGEVIACGICYEHMFTDYTLSLAADSTLMVNLTIDTWFDAGPAPLFHLMLHTSRAVELGTPLIRSALTGLSALVDIDGTVLALLGMRQQGILAVDVPLRDLTPPYRVIGPLFRRICVALALAMLIAICWLRRREKKRTPRVPQAADDSSDPLNLADTGNDRF